MTNDNFRECVLRAVRNVFNRSGYRGRVRPLVLAIEDDDEFHSFPLDKGEETRRRLEESYARCRAVALVGEEDGGMQVRLEFRGVPGVERWSAAIARNPDGTRTMAAFGMMLALGGRLNRPRFDAGGSAYAGA
jgi:hypothetical protein